MQAVCINLRLVALLLLLVFGLPALPAADELGCPAMDVYLRDGCPHCADAKLYLGALQDSYPELTIRYHEVGSDPQALQDLLDLSRQHGVDRPGVPSFLICDSFYAGFSEAAGSDDWIERQLTDPAGAPQGYQVTTPFGVFTLDQLGLPAFTLVLGLIDGFNPCAMWVLLFLLSILVNIHDRRRIVLIAGTFVFVSGLVYFVFMAAWLNLFLIIGFARWLQITIAVLAISIGLIHLKDFFAFGKGVSLSISDGVKPTLYARLRNVLHAQPLWSALAEANQRPGHIYAGGTHAGRTRDVDMRHPSRDIERSGSDTAVTALPHAGCSLTCLSGVIGTFQLLYRHQRVIQVRNGL